MLVAEYSQFEVLIRRMEKIFGKKPLDDETIRSYWDSLKDLSLTVFRGYVERHEKYGRFFPKPADLRAKEDKLPTVQGGKDDSDFREAEARCIRNLEELRQRDPVSWEAQVRVRKLDRLIATTHEGHPAYARIVCEWREARGIHVGETEWQEAGGR